MSPAPRRSPEREDSLLSLKQLTTELLGFVSGRSKKRSLFSISGPYKDKPDTHSEEWMIWLPLPLSGHPTALATTALVEYQKAYIDDNLFLPGKNPSIFQSLGAWTRSGPLTCAQLAFPRHAQIFMETLGSDPITLTLVQKESQIVGGLFLLPPPTIAKLVFQHEFSTPSEPEFDHDRFRPINA
jgi:hypothetical protein